MGVLSWLGLGPKHSDFDHDAPDLEATLPDVVAGRALVRWSIAGEKFWRAARGKPRASGVSELERLGVSANDMQLAVAGRADTRLDPPYMVWVVKFGTLTGAELYGPLPSALAMAVMGIDTNKGENFVDRSIAGRSVMVGNTAMVRQNNHQRGVPYVYVTESAIYALVANEQEWAEEVIRSLPPVRDSAQ